MYSYRSFSTPFKRDAMSSDAILESGVKATAVSEITRRNATMDAEVLTTILGRGCTSHVGAAAVSDVFTLGE